MVDTADAQTRLFEYFILIMQVLGTRNIETYDLVISIIHKSGKKKKNKIKNKLGNYVVYYHTCTRCWPKGFVTTLIKLIYNNNNNSSEEHTNTPTHIYIYICYRFGSFVNIIRSQDYVETANNMSFKYGEKSRLKKNITVIVYVMNYCTIIFAGLAVRRTLI